MDNIVKTMLYVLGIPLRIIVFILILMYPAVNPALLFSGWSLEYLLIAIPVSLFLLNFINYSQSVKKKRLILRDNLRRVIGYNSTIVIIIYVVIFTALPMFGNSAAKSHMTGIVHQALEAMHASSNPILDGKKPVLSLIQNGHLYPEEVTSYFESDIITIDSGDIEWVYFISALECPMWGAQHLCVDSRGVGRDYHVRSTDYFDISECLDGDIIPLYSSNETN